MDLFVERINKHLEGFCRDLRLPGQLKQAIEYALLGGGKRMRPLLAWHSSVAIGAPGEASLPVCVAVELIHAFSLVHDDLPALDNDDLRRGKPTLHKHAGEAMGVLAGDAMLALAFESLMDSVQDARFSHRLLRELASGTMGMIAGQVYDTLGGIEHLADPLERVRTIHANKTGALIRASVRMGGLCGLAATNRGDDHESLAALTAYAEAVGVVFQIADDLLDVEQTIEKAGKRTGKDIERGKLTYPGVIGVDQSRRQMQGLCDVARDALKPFGPRAAGLHALCHEIAHRTH